jgi:hypothetical protein
MGLDGLTLGNRTIQVKRSKSAIVHAVKVKTVGSLDEDTLEVVGTLEASRATPRAASVDGAALAEAALASAANPLRRDQHFLLRQGRKPGRNYKRNRARAHKRDEDALAAIVRRRGQSAASAAARSRRAADAASLEAAKRMVATIGAQLAAGTARASWRGPARSSQTGTLEKRGAGDDFCGAQEKQRPRRRSPSLSRSRSRSRSRERRGRQSTIGSGDDGQRRSRPRR